MKLIKPYFEIINQQPSEIGMLKHIETCGRVAWKSEERTTEDSYIKFIDMLKGVNHGSVLEHGTVYLKVNIFHRETYFKYCHNKYSKTNSIGEAETTINDSKKLIEKPNLEWFGFITTNYRVLVENNWLDDLKYQCEPTEFHEKRITVRFVCDRGVSHEFVRHRTFSFTQESTRYCNYSKNKFGNELTFIIPCWSNDLEEGVYKYSDENGTWIINDYTTAETNNKLFLNHLGSCEWTYFMLLKGYWKPQQARAILPNSLKTELIMTGFISDWKKFFSLRSNKYGRGGAHPQADELATPLYEYFVNNKYINNLK